MSHRQSPRKELFGTWNRQRSHTQSTRVSFGPLWAHQLLPTEYKSWAAEIQHCTDDFNSIRWLSDGKVYKQMAFTFRILDFYLLSSYFTNNNHTTIIYFISLSRLMTSTQYLMALMEKVYSSRWHLLSPRPTPFPSPTISPFNFKRCSSWSTVPQASSSPFLSSWPFLHSACSAVFLWDPVDKCLLKVVPNVG